VDTNSIIPHPGSSGGRNSGNPAGGLLAPWYAQLVPAHARLVRTGGILRLHDALESYPDVDILVYNRVSSYKSAGKRKEKLKEKTDALIEEIRKLAPNNLLRVVTGVEKGKMSEPRRKLLEAVKEAKSQRWPMILVAADHSRFIRSEAFDNETNRKALPTPEEFAQLSAMTGTLILATLLDPAMEERQLHSEATKRTGKCGRPRKIDHELAIRILGWLGTTFSYNGRIEWSEGRSLSKAAKRFGVKKGAVQRLVDSPVPESLCGKPGLSWKDLLEPAEAYRDCLDRGLLRPVSKP
jgi:hypothetical protein